MKKKTGIHELKQDRVFHGFMVALWCIVLFIVLYPLYLVLIASISDPDAVYAGKVFLYPVGFSLRGYQAVLAIMPCGTAISTLLYTPFPAR